MKPTRTLLGLILISSFHVMAQKGDFNFGVLSRNDLTANRYSLDSAASGVFLNEFGEAYISEENLDLIFHYHARFKVLTTDALSFGDYILPLYRQDGQSDKLLSVKASSFSLENGVIKESKLNFRDVHTEDTDKNYKLVKFAVPNVKVGSIIEIDYQTSSPFIFNFKNWNFQSDYPKLHSEYWAKIPGNYQYNMTIKGYLKLSKNDSELVKNCFSVGGLNADCAYYKFGMTNIPAFRMEEYMTARSNYISAINFELAEYRSLTGKLHRYTEEWKDAELKMRRHEQFGLQIKKGKDLAEDQVPVLAAASENELAKAKNIYNFVKNWFIWNGDYGLFTDIGVRKAFEQRKGNIAEINLSLIAIMKSSGLQVEPVILSTRDNGLPIEIHPVLSDFNYVVAKVNIDGKTYLADASDHFLTFDVLPERCLNGKGRVIGEENSYWIDLVPHEKKKRQDIINLTLTEDGILQGSIQTYYRGYEAIEARKELAACVNKSDYDARVKREFPDFEISQVELQNVEDLEKPLVRKVLFTMEAMSGSDGVFLFNPFFTTTFQKNPFPSSSRLYPVDFGTPLEMLSAITVSISDNFEIENLPEKKGIALPNAGGRFLLEAGRNGNAIQVSSALNVNRTYFTSDEYHYLRELFSQVIQSQRTDIVIKRKI